MAFDIGSAIGHIDLDTSGWEKGSESITKSMLKAEVLFAGFEKIVSGVSDAIKGSISAFVESEKVTKQLETVLKSTGNAAGITKDEILEMAKGLQKATNFEDDAIVGAQNLLLTFTKIGKDIFPQATETVLDMSQALGQDLKSSAIQVGKALQDPVLGVTALRRVGVNFSEDQQKVIKALVETGRQAEAQALILKELQVEFGGSARAARDTFGGALAALDIQIGEAKETLGGMIAEGLRPVIEEFTIFVTDLTNNKELLNSISAIIVGVSKTLLDLTRFVIENHDAVLGVIAAITIVPQVFNAATAAVGTLATVMKSASIAAMATPIGLVVSGIAALTIGVIAASSAAKDLEKKMSSVGYVLKQNVTSVEDFKKKMQEAFYIEEKPASVIELKKNLAEVDKELAEQNKLLEQTKASYDGTLKTQTGMISKISFAKNEQQATAEKLNQQAVLQNRINELTAARGILQNKITAQTTTQNDALDKLSKEQKEWLEELKQINETSYATELRHIFEKRDEYIKLGANRIDAEKWANLEIIDLYKDFLKKKEDADKESVDKRKKINDDWNSTVAKSDADSTESKKRSIREQADAFIAGGINAVEVNAWADAEIKKADDDAAKNKIEKFTQAYEQWSGFVNEAVNNIAGLFSSFYENQLTAEDVDYKAKKANIEKTITDETEKTKALEQLEEQHNAKQAQIKKEQWQANKAFAIGQAIMDTANSVLKTFFNFGGWPLGVIPAAIMAGIGAAQIGMIASQPMPAFYRGGVASPGFALVGEQGPEIVNIGRTSRITPADETASILNRGNGVTVSNNFYGDINSELDIERAMQLSGSSYRSTLRSGSR